MKRNSVALLLYMLACTSTAVAQGSKSLSGSLSLNAAFTEGTQQQKSLGATFDVSREAGRLQTELHRLILFRADGTYATAKKPTQERIVSSEVYFGELKASFDASQLRSIFRGRLASRPASTTRTWLYGTASSYHHLAFNLDWEHALGVGLFHDFTPNGVPWSFGAGTDLRYIRETFDGADNFSSWAVRVHETYSKQLTSGGVTFAQSAEVIPAFESGSLQGRAQIEFRVPVTKGFMLSITGGTDYMENAAPPARTSYLKSTLSLTYSFAQ